MARSRKRRRYVNILPSLLTIGNMYCGLLAIVYTINDDFRLAGWMILLGLFFDGSDGHVARLTKSTSAFGKELDSLADVVSFGVAPAILVYRSILQDFHHIGIFIVTVYAITGALRLARYNVQAGGTVKSFTGLPIPGAGCLIASFMLMKDKYDHPFFNESPAIFLTAVFVALLAFLMVSKITYPKQALFRVRRNRAFQYMFILIVLISLIMLQPTLFVFVFFMGYVTIGPLNYLSRNRLFHDPTPKEPEEAEAII
jgi:CDP-diacylglycerol--serine O-phosphatidyltransferase